MVKRRGKKKWIQGAIKRRGGMTKAGTISRSWAAKEQRRLRGKKKRTAVDVRRLRQLSLFLNQLSKKRRRG